MHASPTSPDWPGIVRVLDANANRAAEGLRVIEEYARFSLQDPQLTAAYKQLRHELAAAVDAVPTPYRLLARDTLRDVGARIGADDEYQRSGVRQVVLANQKRVEQALRCLEEYGKTVWPDMARQIEALRYRVYTLARALCLTEDSRQQLAERRLYVLVGGHSSAAALAAECQVLLAAGADIVQLREKSLPDRELLLRAQVLRRLTRDAGRLLILNDRPDLARLAEADGVHLGQEDLPVAEARAIVGPDRLIGVSTHSLTQAQQAVLDGANYIGCGPLFPSTTKQFAAFPGLEFLRQVSQALTLPAFAIGGVTVDNLPEVLAAGASRVAVGAAVTQAADPATAVRSFRERLSHPRG